MKRQQVDTLIKNAFVVTMNARRDMIERGAVAIAGSRIAAVGPTDELAEAYIPRQQLDAQGGVVHPGFIDTHVHFMNAARGAFPDTMDLPSSMNIYRRWWDCVDDEDEYASALLNSIEMLSNGTTCFLEAGTIHNPHAAVEAAERVGIRGFIGDPFLWDMPAAPGVHVMGRAPRDRKRSFDLLGSQLKRNGKADSLVLGCVVLFGLGSASDELVAAAKKMADENGAIFTQHQSFGPNDSGADERRMGKRALCHFADIGVLGHNCTFSHMNDLSTDEMAVVRQAGMSVAWCPGTAMTLATGATMKGPHLHMHRSGVNTALASDGANSACRYDIGLQGLLALLTARERSQKRDAFSAEDVLELATINGARALGMEKEIGSLEPGKRADIVIRTTDLPEAQPGVDPLQTMVYCCGSKSISTVLNKCETVWSAGRPRRIDAGQIYELARKSTERMWTKLGLARQSRWPIVA
ncbi:MAG: amidohydrolase family protein [Parvibaculaceae bacterium]